MNFRVRIGKDAVKIMMNGGQVTVNGGLVTHSYYRPVSRQHLVILNRKSRQR